jgi:hypothetical protein
MLFEQKIEVVILDFDGVVIESNDIKDSWYLMSSSNVFPNSMKTHCNYHRSHVSVSRYAKFDYLLEQLGKNRRCGFKETIAG